MVDKALVRMPDGRVLTADVGGLTGTGHRFASVRLSRGGEQFRIAGRVSTRHGYDSVIPFEVKLNCINALTAFEDTDAYAD